MGVNGMPTGSASERLNVPWGVSAGEGFMPSHK
ncbi:hypothetical protein Premu_2276 [Hallella multisaccharivorax DSM 17128]|uniref:Uncharacterized protein n=1 Tax=Hallella multisaccharivorax DSM 17128 TaxID=688246 RepID=F8N8R7_9BACT|nr:hypothetical protein Premu_2276 [Hallella multisaccharivorax DSM 17128]